MPAYRSSHNMRRSTPWCNSGPLSHCAPVAKRLHALCQTDSTNRASCDIAAVVAGGCQHRSVLLEQLRRVVMGHRGGAHVCLAGEGVGAVELRGDGARVGEGALAP